MSEGPLDEIDLCSLEATILEGQLFEAIRLFIARYGFERAREQTAYSLIVAGNTEANKWLRN